MVENNETIHPIILLSAPPKSGKDFLCNILQDELFHVLPLSLTYAGKIAAMAVHGYTENDISFEEMEAVKDMPLENEPDRTWRMQIIETIELYKAFYGQNFWASKTCNIIKDLEPHLKKEKVRSLVIITDPSMPIDVETFESRYPDRTILIRLHRDGCAFNKHSGFEEAYGVNTGSDSRNWLFSDKLSSYDLYNNGTPKNLIHNFLRIVMDKFSLKNLHSERENPFVKKALIVRRTDLDLPMEPFAKPYIVKYPELTTKIA